MDSFIKQFKCEWTDLTGMGEVEELTLIRIAEKIDNVTKFKILAAKLKIKPEMANNFWKTNLMLNEITSDGTLAMFHAWKQDTIASKQRSQLKQALIDADYTGIAEKHFGPLNEGESGRKRPAETQHQVEVPVAKKMFVRQNVPETAVKPEDKLDEVKEILPDHKGYYNDPICKAKPTDDQLDTEENYFMARAEKGMVFILNNFSENRTGSRIDVKNIAHVFEGIGYESVIERNLDSTKIRKSLDDLIEHDIVKDHTSVVLVLMSHGNKSGILGTDRETVSLQEIKEKFYATKCPALQGKPKIIFVQACRGKKITPSVMTDDEPSTSTSGERDNSVTSEVEPIIMLGDEAVGIVDLDYERIPDNADIFVANATSEGYYSYRTPNGSWFIQILCEELIAKAHEHHLDSIMNAVSRRVKTKVGIPKGMKVLSQQTPDISKQGIGKNIFFLPKYPGDE